jgi:hypothetical protein
MSLRGFHIVFITLSTLLAAGVGGWCLWINSIEGTPVFLIGAVCGFVAAVSLIIYGIWFYRKMKRLRIVI